MIIAEQMEVPWQGIKRAAAIGAGGKEAAQ